MSKSEIFLSHVDEVVAAMYIGEETNLNPEIKFKREVDREVGRIESIIAESDATRSITSTRLVGYGTDYVMEDHYVRGTAMRQVLGHLGLLDAYDWASFSYPEGGYRPPARGRNRVCYQEMPNGWIMDLMVPRTMATIRVMDVLSQRTEKEKGQDVTVNTERWTFFYTACSKLQF